MINTMIHVSGTTVPRCGAPNPIIGYVAPCTTLHIPLNTAAFGSPRYSVAPIPFDAPALLQAAMCSMQPSTTHRPASDARRGQYIEIDNHRVEPVIPWTSVMWIV
jgi:hypothetical protein